MTQGLLLALGGGLGSMARYAVGRVFEKGRTPAFPAATFLINISGAFLLGILVAVSPPKAFYALLGDGFLGAFTTYSTFMADGVRLLKGAKGKMPLFIF
jgi:CrcB protein